MADTKSPTVHEVIQARFSEYALALGKVAHAWNVLHESLGKLFGLVAKIDEHTAFGIWYSTPSDRGQRQMLKAALLTSNFLDNYKKGAKADVEWLINKTDSLADMRNDAIHAPCGLLMANRQFEITASYFNGNPRATKLKGKVILKEFAYYEAYADVLTYFAKHIENAITVHKKWPARPNLPSR